MAGLGDWETIDTTTNRREGERAQLMLFSQSHSVAIAAAQDLCFLVSIALPNRPNGMDHIPGW